MKGREDEQNHTRKCKPKSLTCKLFNVPLKLAFDESTSARLRFVGSLKYICAIPGCWRTTYVRYIIIYTPHRTILTHSRLNVPSLSSGPIRDSLSKFAAVTSTPKPSPSHCGILVIISAMGFTPTRASMPPMTPRHAESPPLPPMPSDGMVRVCAMRVRTRVLSVVKSSS